MSTVSAATVRSRLKSHGLELSKRRPSSIKGMVEEALDAAVPALTGFGLVRTAWSITVRRSESA